MSGVVGWVTLRGCLRLLGVGEVVGWVRLLGVGEVAGWVKLWGWGLVRLWGGLSYGVGGLKSG